MISLIRKHPYIGCSFGRLVKEDNFPSRHGIGLGLVVNPRIMRDACVNSSIDDMFRP
jgi:hypothetical protein